MSTDQSREMDDVARHLARTRSQLDRTLDELGRRLDPDNLRSEAKTYVRDRFVQVRERASAFTSEHAVASLGALAALTALATMVRRRNSHGRDVERALRTLLEANGLDPGEITVARPTSGGRRVAMLAAIAGLGWAAIAAGRGTSTAAQRPSRPRRRPPLLA